MLRRVLLSLLAYGGQQGTGILIQIISVPVFLKIFGGEDFGIWLTLFSICSFFNFANNSFTATAANGVQIAVVQEKRHLASAQFSCLLLASVLPLALAPAVFLLFSWIDFAEFLNAPILSGRYRLLPFLVYCQVAVGFMEAPIIAAFRAANRNHVGIGLSVASRVAEGVVSVAVAIASHDLLLVAIWVILVKIVMLIVMGICFQLSTFENTLSWAMPRLHVVLPMLKDAMYFVPIPLSLLATLQIPLLVVSAELGPTVVALFSVHRTMARLSIQFSGVFVQSLWPEFSRTIAKNQLTEARRLFERLTSISILVTFGAILVYLFAGERLMSWWTQGQIEFDYRLLGALLFSALLNSLWNGSSVVLASVNQHARFSLAYLLASLFSLMTFSICLVRFELWVAVLSLALVDVIMTIFTVPLAVRLFGSTLSSFLVRLPFEIAQTPFSLLGLAYGFVVRAQKGTVKVLPRPGE